MGDSNLQHDVNVLFGLGNSKLTYSVSLSLKEHTVKLNNGFVHSCFCACWIQERSNDVVVLETRVLVSRRLEDKNESLGLGLGLGS